MFICSWQTVDLSREVTGIQVCSKIETSQIHWLIIMFLFNLQLWGVLFKPISAQTNLSFLFSWGPQKIMGFPPKWINIDENEASGMTPMEVPLWQTSLLASTTFRDLNVCTRDTDPPLGLGEAISSGEKLLRIKVGQDGSLHGDEFKPLFFGPEVSGPPLWSVQNHSGTIHWLQAFAKDEIPLSPWYILSSHRRHHLENWADRTI